MAAAKPRTRRAPAKAAPAKPDPKDDAAAVDEVSPSDRPPIVEPKDTSPKNKGGRPSNTERLAKQLGEMTTMIGITVGMTIDRRDGMVIVENAPDFAAALAKLAETNQRVRRLLESSMNGSAWAGVILVTGRMSLQIAANHGVKVPPILIGSAPPEPSTASANGST